MVILFLNFTKVNYANIAFFCNLQYINIYIMTIVDSSVKSSSSVCIKVFLLAFFSMYHTSSPQLWLSYVFLTVKEVFRKTINLLSTINIKNDIYRWFVDYNNSITFLKNHGKLNMQQITKIIWIVIIIDLAILFLKVMNVIAVAVVTFLFV